MQPIVSKSFPFLNPKNYFFGISFYLFCHAELAGLSKMAWKRCPIGYIVFPDLLNVFLWDQQLNSKSAPVVSLTCTVSFHASRLARVLEQKCSVVAFHIGFPVLRL